MIHLSSSHVKTVAKPITARKKVKVTRMAKKPVRVRQLRRPVVVMALSSAGKSAQPKKVLGANAGGPPPQKRPMAESHATRQAPTISPETMQVPAGSNEMPNPSLPHSTQPQPGAGSVNQQVG